MADRVALAVDIGGTFTDVALEIGDRLHTTKLLTTPAAPERAVLEGIDTVLSQSGVDPGDITLFVHGTTLATNAIIERKGAVTALLTTEGFRDSVEIAYENRFEQYDINMDRPQPLVPRFLRLGIPERLSARGDVLRPLDEAAVTDAAAMLREADVQAVAVGYLHSYLDGSHERRTRELLNATLPGVAVTLSCEVCPEIREYERFSTTCANAYVQPLMARYLRALDAAIRQRGLGCPFLLLQSSGGLCTLDQAVARPVMLVESGPAGGALLAARLAAQHGLDRVISFDMGGTTAKLCLIEDAEPATARTFEVARMYRFLKGSGLPLRIPVIDMVEIGAGGGSIASVDGLGRVRVGPESAAGEPGPACYGLGGTRPTVTDADVVLGRIDPVGFAGGTMTLDLDAAEGAVLADVGAALGLDSRLAAFAISELVDENMANAARVHAVERGRDVRRCTMVAFGGAAPLHACRLADKLGIDTVIVPAGAGVGSAIGFLRAPVSYEAVRTRYLRLGSFDEAVVAATLAELRAEAEGVVGAAAPGVAAEARCRAAMRYVGQGHEVEVPVPLDRAVDPTELHAAFETVYRSHFTRTIPHLEVEVLSWVLTLATVTDPPVPLVIPAGSATAPTTGTRAAFDPQSGEVVNHAVLKRADLQPGLTVTGPALIEEDQTTTVVATGFTANVDTAGNLILRR